MSRADVETEILAPMQATFLPPRDLSTDETKLALKGYIAVLAAFDGPTLSRAWADVLAAHKTRAWPVIGVIFAAANKARKERTETHGNVPAASTNPWNAISDSVKRVMWERVRTTPLAQKASELGVAWSLKCAVLHDGTPIDRIDLRALRATKNRAERTAKAIADGASLEHDGRLIGIFGGIKKDTALDMWRTMQMRETETQGEIIEHQKGNTHAAHQTA